MKTILIFAILTLFSIGSFAADEIVKEGPKVKAEASMDPLPHNGTILKAQYGLGLGDVADGEILNGSERNFNIGCYSKLNKVLGWGTHVGLISAEDETSYYAFAQFGSELHPFEWMYVDHYFGPGYVSKGNSKMSEGLNFSMHMGMGWRDPVAGTTIGMNWKHISNAGLREPNRGMDFLLVQVGYPL